MKLIAEIAAKEGGTLRVTYDGEYLELSGIQVDLAEFRLALDAVAGPVKPPVAPRAPREVLGGPLDYLTVAPVAEPTRNPDGSRRGESPRFAMRARPAPEANVEDDAA